MNHLEQNYEGIDAAVFNGDILFNKDSRQMLKNYMTRWGRAITAYEQAAAEERIAESKP